jgi:hypothetical protein
MDLFDKNPIAFCLTDDNQIYLFAIKNKKIEIINNFTYKDDLKEFIGFDFQFQVFYVKKLHSGILRVEMKKTETNSVEFYPDE